MILKNVFDELFDLKYVSNTFSVQAHEETIKSVLENHNFKGVKYLKTVFNDIGISPLYKISNTIKDLKSIREYALLSKILQLNKYDELFFIYQPFSDNCSPDFLISYKYYIIELECKSNKSDQIKWSKLPDPTAIYHFTCEKYNKSTLFLGSDILSKKARKCADKYEEKLKIYSEEIKADCRNNNILDFYLRSRPDWNQYIDITFINNKKRENRENSVKELINFIEEEVNN